MNEELPADGTYLLAVSNIAPPQLNAPFGGINYSYTLSITENIDDHASCGSGEETPLVWDEPITGVISPFSDPDNPFGDDSDGFRFDAAAGDVIALHLEVESADQFTYVSLNLFDEAGEELVSTFGESELRIDGYEIHADGVYCVEISGGYSTDEDTPYTLTLSEGELQDDDHDARWGSPTPIQAEVPTEGVINFDGDTDAFQFTATGDSIIRLNVELNPNLLFAGVSVSLYDADFEFLAESIWSGFEDDTLLEFDELRNGFTIRTNGTYYIEVESFFGETGDDFSYTLTLIFDEGGVFGVFPPYDVNQDGKVDVFDLVLVGQHFGENFITATPPADFGQLRSVLPERRVAASDDAECDRYTTVDCLYRHHSDRRSLRLPFLYSV